MPLPSYLPYAKPLRSDLPPPPIFGVLFDFDGTLIDASEAICTAFHQACRMHALAVVDAATIRSWIGRPLREMFLRVQPSATSMQVDAYVQSYRDAFHPISVPLSRPLPGVGRALAALGRQGRLAVVTTRMADGAWQILRGHGLDVHFSAVVGIEHVTNPKPHPEPVLLALEKLHVDPRHAWMVGDTPDDVAAGRAAGVTTVGITTGAYQRDALVAAGAEYVIASADELLSLVVRRRCFAGAGL
jgi:pyrophosphatase PpaX